MRLGLKQFPHLNRKARGRAVEILAEAAEAVPIVARSSHAMVRTMTAEQVKEGGIRAGQSFTFDVEEGDVTHTHCGVVPDFQEDGSVVFRMGLTTYAGQRPTGTPRPAGMRNPLARQSNAEPI